VNDICPWNVSDLRYIWLLILNTIKKTVYIYIMAWSSVVTHTQTAVRVEDMRRSRRRRRGGGGGGGGGGRGGGGGGEEEEEEEEMRRRRRR
jgi:uncharacterized membrane protein